MFNINMTNLSMALEKYYKRRSNKIIFNNNQSLNQLALTLWELLGYQQVDTSVLSRVVNGKRLFTVHQLDIFCKILSLNNKEKDYLFNCLSNDILVKNDIPLDYFSLPVSMGYEIIKSLIDDSYKALYAGKSKMLVDKCNLNESLISMIKDYRNENLTELIDKLKAHNLYLKGRTILWYESQRNAFREISIISNQLLEIAEKYKNNTIYSYANVLRGCAYYVAGGYSYSHSKRNFYTNSIKFSKTALKYLSENDNEKLLALRTIAVSAAYLKDEETISYVYKKTKNILSNQPLENRLNAMLLCGSLSKGLAIIHNTEPFTIKESAYKYFGKDLSNTGTYEVSDIKEEIGTLIILNTNDTNYIHSRIKQGIKISKKNNYIRHKQYFMNFLKTDSKILG